MLRWLLSQMEAYPSATFSAGMLRERFGDEFKRRVDDGSLRLVTAAPEYALDAHGKRRVVVYEHHDAAVLVDEDDAESEPVAVHVPDIGEWAVNLPVVIDRLREQNRITGPRGRLSDRLWLVGSYETSAGTAAAVIAFVTESSADSAMRALVTLLPTTTATFVVGLPAFQPDVRQQRHYEQLRIRCVSFEPPPSLRIALPPDLAPLSTRPARARGETSGGRPRGVGIGAMLACWIACHGAFDRFDAKADFYDAAFKYLTTHQMLGTPPMTREALPRRVADARRGRRSGPCLYRQHSAGIPPDLSPD